MSSKKTQSYTAEDIDVLTGLDPVKRRPGMYTDTTKPNHLACEAIDNSVDEAIAGYADHISVVLHKDQSLSVSDNGRGIPTDKHPKEKISGVELILTRLHAGGKFSNKNYQFSGGLHGVGISVVNALSHKMLVNVKRDGHSYDIEFASGKALAPLKKTGKVKARETGTAVHFWPDKKYFDTANFSLVQLKNTLRAKAVLCPGLTTELLDEKSGQSWEWCYTDGLSSYLQTYLNDSETLPSEPWTGKFESAAQMAEWALCWSIDSPSLVGESYVNLIPTAQGGTHVNGLRSGLLEAVREFCEIHSLLPRGIRLTADDLWEHCNYVLSVKINDPLFAGQTKERLNSRECAGFVSGLVKDAFSLWLNKHTTAGKQLAELAISQAQKRMRLAKKITRKKITSGPALPGKLTDCSSQEMEKGELFLVEGDSAGGSAKQARDRTFQAIMPLRGKILNTWEVASEQVLASQEVHDIAIALGVDPGSTDLSGLRYGKICILADADSDGNHIATLLCALFYRHFLPLLQAGRIYVAMPPLYRIDVAKEVYYALDENEKNGILAQIEAEKKKGKVMIQRFKGLGEMNPSQLRETTLNPDTRRLVQLIADEIDPTKHIMDMLLGKKRAKDRKAWLESSDSGLAADTTD